MIVGSVIGAAVAPASELVRSAVSASAPQRSFASVLGQIAEDAVNAVRKSETVSARGLAGTANVQEVVASVMEAERHVQTAVAVRDKLVSAYQEIIRMQI